MSSLTAIRKKWWPATIRNQLIWGIALVHLSLMTIFVFDLVQRQRVFLKTQNQKQTFDFVNDYAVNSAAYIVAHDFDELERLTLSYTNFPNLKYAMILSPEGIVLAHTNANYIGKKLSDKISLQLQNEVKSKTLIENDEMLDVAVPIFLNNNMVGWARAGIDQEHIQTNLAAIMRNGIVYILIALLVGILFALIIGNRLTAGLYKLISTAGKITAGERSIRATSFESVELSKLGMVFNQMLDTISANETLLRMVIDNMPVGVWIFNEKGSIISGNSAGKEIWQGQRYVDMSEFNIYKAWSAETNELISSEQWASSRAIFKGETTINEELNIETFDGTRKTILNSAIPLRGNGNIIGAIAINVDMTERKNISNQLALSESTFRSAFDYSAIGITLVSPKGEFMRVNKALCRMVGYTEEQLLSLTFQQITHPDDLEADLAFVRQTLNGEIDSYRMEKRYFHKEGNIIWVHLSVSLVRDDRQQPLFFVSQIEDITERKMITEQLALSESTLRSAFDHSATAMALVSTSGKFLRVNKELCKLFGYTEEEALSLSFQDITHPDELEQNLYYVRRTLEGEIPSFRMEKRYIHKNRTVVWANLNVSLVRDSQNKPSFFVSQIEDISERKKAAAQIQESEEKFRKLVEESLVGVFILQEGRFVYVNPQFEKITGYDKTTLLNDTSFRALTQSDDRDETGTNVLSIIMQQMHSSRHLLKATRQDGAVLQLEAILSPITYSGKAAFIGTVIDITQQVEEEKRINKAVADAQENERQQISMELHDNVKQLMAGCLLNIDFIKMISRDEKTGPIIDNIKNYLRDAIEELRRISHQLAPSIDTNISFEEKIKTVINTMNVSNTLGINYRFDAPEEVIKVDMQLAMYRIVQEQFANILKHANATLVEIAVQRHNGDICLLIEDNGVGFDMRTPRNGIGLENIKRRVQVFNGNFSIQTFPGKGCRLHVQFPVN